MKRRRPALGLVTFLLLAACAGEPAEGADTVSPDTADSAIFDVSQEDAVPNDADIALLDGLGGDSSDVEEEIFDVDVTEVDAVDCSVPREGCPCNPDAGPQECCLFAGTGLSCSSFFSQWSMFSDCGCSPLPECSSYPLHDLCPQ